MDRARVEAQLRQLERLIEDPPPLLSLVVLASGAGVAYAHPMLQTASRGTLEEREAALMLVRVFLLDLTAHVDQRLDEIVRASARETHNVVESL